MNNTPEISFENAALSDITAITEFVEEELEKLDCPPKVTVRMNIAIDEIYSNIVKFAYDGAPGPAAVRIEPSSDPLGVALVFIDEGVPYDPLSHTDPDVSKSADEREIGGLGIFMVKKSMDDVSYEYRDNKNMLRIFKKYA